MTSFEIVRALIFDTFSDIFTISFGGITWAFAIAWFFAIIFFMKGIKK